MLCIRRRYQARRDKNISWWPGDRSTAKKALGEALEPAMANMAAGAADSNNKGKGKGRKNQGGKGGNGNQDPGKEETKKLQKDIKAFLNPVL